MCLSLFKTDKLNSPWKVAGDSFWAMNTARALKLHVVIYGYVSGYVEDLTYIEERAQQTISKWVLVIIY